MTEPIVWHTKKVKLGDLKDYEHNPRRISKKDFERLVNDIKQDGYHNRIIVDTDNNIIGGHSRKKALLAAGFSEDVFIEVLIPSRRLSETEYKRINIRDNLPFGEYDFDILGNHFDPTELIEWGMPEIWFDVDKAVENKPHDDSDKTEDSDQDELPGNICATCPFKDAA